MHMADALVSPAVGGTLWVVSGGLIAVCARTLKHTWRDPLVPMMGVLGALMFAAQMINFSIPGTGSSGHLGGGLILTVLLGPYAAFLVMASILTVQALFFADGGLLALGCNMFNLGFFPAFIAYPLVYKPIVNDQYRTLRGWVGAILAAVVGLQLGAVGVTLQTTASGISELSFGAFALMMLPIHLAIGVVEGVATAAVISFVARMRPEVLPMAPSAGSSVGLRPVLIGLAVTALVLGGMGSWFASTKPDGLEWSISRVSGQEELERPPVGIHESLAKIQETTAFLPDYGFKTTEAETARTGHATSESDVWPAIRAGTSISGVVGSLMTLALAGLIGMLLKGYSSRRLSERG